MATIGDARVQVSHLMRRAGFGATPAELDRYSATGFDALVTHLLDFNEHSTEPDLEQAITHDVTLNQNQKRNSVGAGAIWLYRMANTAYPLREKMTLFWHGHFATAISKVRSPELMVRQNDLFRKLALGNFRDMLRQVSRDPAMMIWLDTVRNRKAQANENYARELMELFTMGIGNYTEQDVKQGARAFTGWTLAGYNGKDTNPADIKFAFNARQHDDGSKVFLGKTGNWNGDDVLDIILEQPATARFIARKLIVFFVTDTPSDAYIDRMATVFRNSNYDTRALVEAILRSPEFLDEANYRAQLKMPVEFAVSTVRLLSVKVPWAQLATVCRQLGQELYNPPNVAGWPGGRNWVSTALLLNRFNFANQLATGVGQSKQMYTDPRKMLLDANSTATTVDGVDYFTRLLLDGKLSDQARAAITKYATSGTGSGSVNPQSRDSDVKMRGLLHLVMTMPEYQLK